MPCCVKHVVAFVCSYVSIFDFIVALLIVGDGNCLMHAVSLALWSFSDHNTLLRRLVYYAFASDRGAFQRRWKRRQERVDHEEGGMLHTDEVSDKLCVPGIHLLIFTAHGDT